MKTRKATGADGVAVEMFSAFKDLGVLKLTNSLNKMYDTGNILKDLLKSVFIALLKKPGFDTINHELLIRILQNLSIDGKDLRIMKNLYSQQTAEYIMQELKGLPGTKVGGHNINNLRYADDTVLIGRSEADLLHLLDIVDRESKNVRLGLNVKKTVTMVTSKKTDKPTCNLKLKDSTLVQVEKFKYLGSTIDSDGRSALEKIQTSLHFNEYLAIVTAFRYLAPKALKLNRNLSDVVPSGV
ncbi:hypothetical protein CAPTEDRAFT_200271 [Capitella teleta]|uniref:Reverse transcriptase domain-containing protein n=1 Tax=Capitella teleta TaxID=283909 RepID=R7UX26_CAPTE|nr:hypothetical protein CAPTEDRAFT_200271 [Capitella teleta]|eukprot:ELU10827.1 hypothetical protein CAPTEDRAFT_200271 [Capitella teleta]